MLQIAFCWVFIFFTSIILGSLFCCAIKKLFGYELIDIASVSLAGIVILTVFSEYISLFAGVGQWAGCSVLFACVCGLIFFRKAVFSHLRIVFHNITVTMYLYFGVLIIGWLFFSSLGYQHTDTALYHIQAISWIEKFGVVKGLGNLHNRLGYNSSIFSLYALFTMREVFPEAPVYCVNGYIALLISASLHPLLGVFKRKRLRIADFSMLATAYYLFCISDEIISPASDYLTVLLVFFVINSWLILIENEGGERKSIIPFCLLCVLIVYAVSVKVTTGVLILLLVKPAAVLIKEKKGKEIVFFLALGIGIAMPWLIRNVLITGYIVYPLPGIDLFDFDWEMHPEIVAADAYQIKVWGKGVNAYPLEYHRSFKWVPIWWRTMLSTIEKVIVAGDLFSVPIVIVLLIRDIIKGEIRSRKDYYLVVMSVMACYFCWQLLAPLPRYGYCYILLPPTLAVGEIICRMSRQTWIKCLMAVFLAYKCVMLSQYIYLHSATFIYNYLLFPQQMRDVECDAYEVSGVTFSANANAYEPAKQQLYIRSDIVLRGKDIRDGFRYNYH